MTFVIPTLDNLAEIFADAQRDGVIWGIVVYVLMKPIMTKIFQNRSLYEKWRTQWKISMTAYNVCMCLYSLTTFVLSVSALRAGKGLFTPFAGDVSASPGYLILAYCFFMSKYVEYLDTIFLIVAGKPVSFLQYFHHLGAPIDMWILWRYANPASWIFVVFNSFIHTLMYLYYAASIQGVQLSAIKWLMTFLQIMQLVFGTALSFWYPLNQADFAGSYQRMTGFFVSTFYTGSLVILFVKFFVESYVVKAPKDGGAKTKKRE